ncbi:response regulator transcription factor [Streptomyces sp. NBC_01136]|uniref:helix-turn-helix transcriptional regulator n=1 Tax=unclassified Streptomyces TaxID=2593676 RepID=UPI0032454278|nr:response regulator transcription factor [Streptomyces sp. NBC_01136]
MSLISVAVHATDPITRLGLIGHIRMEPRLSLVAPAQLQEADVVVVAVDTVVVATLDMLRQLSAGMTDPRFLLIVGDQWQADLYAALEGGVRAVMWRSEFTPAAFTNTVVSVGEGHGDFPPELQGKLFDQVLRTNRDVLALHGLTASGLTPREIDVLRLVSEGCDLQEIAQKLSYSERTVKNILYNLTKRLNLRNRTHAVAYAVRCGLI